MLIDPTDARFENREGGALKNLKHLPMDVLRTFITIVEQHSITRAGEALGRSQPAISLQVKRLEKILGVPLFQRRGRQFALSPSGEKLLTYAERILKLNDEAVEEISVPTLSGHLRFGIPSEFATAVLPKIIGRFAKQYPDITLEVTTDLSKRLVEKFDRQELDVILALRDEPEARCGQFLRQDELVWVGGRHDDGKFGNPIPLVAAPEGCIYRKRMIQTLNRNHQDYNIVYTILDLPGMEVAIKKGLGITALAKSTVPASLGIIKATGKLPELGTIAISTLAQNKEGNEALRRLVRYVSTNL